jgi:uncharacterized protein (TIGR03382 family)
MNFRMSSSLIAGACVVASLVAPSPARAYVKGGASGTWQNLDKQARTRPPTTETSWERVQAPIPGHPWNSRDPDQSPGGATTPIPEPGTLTLASLGLLALGAARRKRRGPDAPTRVKTR